MYEPMSLDPNDKGNIAEAAIAFHAARLRIPVLRPACEHTRYDLVLDMGSRLLRVQCKWAALEGEVVAVRAVTSRRGPNGFVRGHYSAEEVDALAAYCPDTDECYLVPIEAFDGRSQMCLRYGPPRNGQRASIHYAGEYRLGAVAQLEERRLGKAEATGSSPVSSTTPPSGASVVGAHEFRNRFGWYMERAAGGEEVWITFRGRPRARLLPA